MSTVAHRGPSSLTVEASSIDDERKAVGRVSAIYRSFLRDVSGIVRGVSRPLLPQDEDCAGADFAFTIEVRQSDYERVVTETSALEARYFSDHGVNFVVIPEVL